MRQEAYVKSLKNIRNAFLLMYFSINLGTIDILPAWLGYIFMYYSILDISKEEKTALLLKKLVTSLIVYNFMIWICKILNFNLDIHIIREIFMIISIYVDFQLMTHIIDISIRHQSKMTSKLRNVRNIHVILLTYLSLSVYLTDFSILIILNYIIMSICLILVVIQIIYLNTYIKEEKNLI